MTDRVAFTSAHIAALTRYSKNLSILCISEMDPLRQVPPAIQLSTSIPDIAQLTGLTKLRLQFDNPSQLAGFQPLGQLSSVEHLVLDCKWDSASCADVLKSNGDTLRQVSLFSNSWTMDTYTALQQIHSLDVLEVCLYVPSAPQIDALAGITARSFRLVLLQIQFLPDPVLLHLTAANPAVHNLWLFGIDDTCCQQLGSLPSLQTLTVLNSPLLTSASFNTQPSVTRLLFIDCPSVSLQARQRIMRTAMPACRCSAMHAVVGVLAEVEPVFGFILQGLDHCITLGVFCALLSIPVKAGIEKLRSTSER